MMPSGVVVCAAFAFMGPLLPVGLETETGNGEVRAHATSEVESLGAPTSGAASGDLWMRHALCREWITVELTGQMFPGVWSGDIPECVTVLPPPTNLCPPEEIPLAPWWVSRDLGGGAYGPWTQVGGYQCTSDILYTLVAEAWVSMPIVPNTYEVQPSGGFAVAELGVNLMVDTNPRTMDVTLLGTPVIIRAVATQYTWMNTDGTVWTSTDPGKPYAEGGEPFTFPRKPEHRTTFMLTTTWRGEFSINNGVTWRDAPGTATTTSNATTVHVYNPHAHRVDCDLDGNCVNGTQGAGNQKTTYDPDGDGILNYLIPDDKIDDYLTARDQDRTWTDPERKNTG